MSRRSANPRCGLAVTLALAAACAHRYSDDRADWVGPRHADFDADFAACRQVMDDAPFRFRGDPRLLFLACMEERDWFLKDRS